MRACVISAKEVTKCSVGIVPASRARRSDYGFELGKFVNSVSHSVSPFL